ncbi:hypothetical protein BDV18DRAFT_139580 [Aspergillus unguis]
MKLFTALCLVAAATAASTPPSEKNPYPIPDEVTIAKGVTTCGESAQLSCCKKSRSSGEPSQETNNLMPTGFPNGIMAYGANGAMGLYAQCSEIENKSANSSDTINQSCKESAACCPMIPQGMGNGLADGERPCLALGYLL